MYAVLHAPKFLSRKFMHNDPDIHLRPSIINAAERVYML